LILASELALSAGSRSTILLIRVITAVVPTVAFPSQRYAVVVVASEIASAAH